MCVELQMNRDQYVSVYLSEEVLDNAIFRIGSHSNGHAPYIHWMEAPMALYSAATFLNISIDYYGSADGNPMYKCLVLPLRKAVGMHSVNKVIHICWMNSNRFIQLLMNDDSSPCRQSSNHGGKQLTILPDISKHILVAGFCFGIDYTDHDHHNVITPLKML
ncbi:uncharacterized protein LOC130818925 [Amaranthus tricolor]|uniref:uncharacterized protein LOC130818925 n=1 Tax=Amaranthus tricolor TaxID=29722 RepID=UPI00258B2462|nr:uncharacterized protein LOC130818925 [Amaranthus tricolor]